MIPTNEQGVVALFSEYAGELGYIFKRIQAGCPDAIMEKDGSEVRIEFEFNALNFKKHGHDQAKVDMIVCWNDDWPGSPIPVLSLQMYLTLYRGRAPKEPAWLRFLNWLQLVKTARMANLVALQLACPVCSTAMAPRTKYADWTWEHANGDILRNGIIFRTCPKCGYTESEATFREDLGDD